MTKKACCCDKGQWIAIPCRYWGSNFFSGYNINGFNGFTAAIQNQLISALKNHPAFGISGPYGGAHPFFKLPEFDFGYTSVPVKIKGKTCDNQLPGGAFGGYGGGFGGCIQPKCFDIVVDEERDTIYKAWGAGGGGKSKTLFGGNGAFAQKRGTYKKNYIACVGFGGMDYRAGQSFTGWTGNIETISGGGGQGYGAWGGGAAFISTNISAEDAFLIAGGGGGAGSESGAGGHGGVTLGKDALGPQGGKGGMAGSGGSGGSGGQKGQGTKGGRGAKILGSYFDSGLHGGTFDVVLFGGGGGGGGLGGGGGGGIETINGFTAAYGGGGGSSQVTPLGRSATDSGPPNMCDPMFWGTGKASMGGYFQSNSSNDYTNANGGFGLPGKIAWQFAALRCPCDESLSTIPTKTYICLSDAQAGYICSQLQNCCGTDGSTGTTGSSGITGISGPTGATGITGATGMSGPTGVCYYSCGANVLGMTSTIPTRGNTGIFGRGPTGATTSVNQVQFGGGCGGLWAGAFDCSGSSGASGASGGGFGGISGVDFDPLTPTGEAQEYKYRTFRYEGELYYLTYQCDFLCDPEYTIPEDAEFTDIGCRPYADCCKGLYALPLCKVEDDNPTIECWITDNCPCNPRDVCPEPFISCQDPDEFPDAFYTQVDDWYYLVWKTQLWEPFGDQLYKRGTVGAVILEDPCASCNDAFGTNPGGTCDGQTEEDGTTIGNNNGSQNNPTNCCIEVRDEWDGVSPWKAEVSVSISYTGQIPRNVGCDPANSCDCAFEGSYTDSETFTAIIPPNSFYYYEAKPGGDCVTPPCDPFPPQTIQGNFKSIIYGFGIPGFDPNTYATYFNPYNPTSAGSGLVEACFPLESNPCVIYGFPTRPEDITSTTRKDPGYKIIVECVVEDPDCIDANSSLPEAYIPLYREVGNYGGVGCEWDDGLPSNEGPRIYAAGCRIDTYVAKLNQYSGGHYQAVRLSAPNSYWIGGMRDPAAGVPGDNYDSVEYDSTFRTEGNKVIQRIEMTVYFNSPIYPIYVLFSGKSVPNCCEFSPGMIWTQSSCGRAKPADWGCGTFLNQCPEVERVVVQTYRTLQQCEDNPSITMLNPKCIYLGYSGFVCSDMYDDYDGAQTCTVTFI